MNLETKNFYKNLIRIVGPMALQNLITAAVSSADVIMLGKVNQTVLAASSLAGQIQFVLFLFFSGISSGLLMLCAQYWGKKDAHSIETIAGIAFKLSVSVGFIFGVAAFCFPRFLMKIFTNDENMILAGSQYLRWVAPSYFLLSISQVFEATFKSIERVKTVTAITFTTLGLNVILNAIFIFGLLGNPAMGIRGAAFATSIARGVEVLICVLIAARLKDIKIRLEIIFRKNAVLLRDFFHFSLPALGNELIWGAAFATYSVILGHLGEDIVAANSVVNVARNLASVVVFGIGYGGQILLGKEMGSGDLGVAERDASRLWRSAFWAGVVGGIVMIALKPVLPLLADLDSSALRLMNIMVYINSYSILGASVNTVFICGIFRAGGDSKFGFVIDTISMWAVSVPLGLLAWLAFKLPPIWVYFVLYLDEFEKMAIVIHHYRKKKWLRDITR